MQRARHMLVDGHEDFSDMYFNARHRVARIVSRGDV